MLRIWIFFICLFVAVCLGSVSKFRPLFPDHRIIGGRKTDIRNHPHQLTFQLYASHICGASIISKKWAVTAGHCFGNAPLRYYRIGSGSSGTRGGTFYNVSKIIRHPDYHSSKIDYDVALIQISGEFKFTSDTKPIVLAKQELLAGKMVNVTGWGSTQPGGGVTGELMEVSVPIVDREDCEEAYKNVNPVTARMICAGDFGVGGKDSCQGDSGGPLSVNGTLYGIVSWGMGCGQPDYPGVYSNVAVLRPWILETIKEFEESEA